MWGCCFPVACAKLSAYLKHPAPDMDEQGLPRLCIACHAVLQNHRAFKSLHIFMQKHTRLGIACHVLLQSLLAVQQILTCKTCCGRSL